jgi:chromosome segregation ATPase
VADGAPQQERLFLLARIENLEKEKVALQRELDHLSANLRQAAAENAELAKRVDQQTLNFQDKARAIGDLEQKLQEAEIEAKAVQQEYMVLYARSQAEKGIMKQD